MAIDLIYPVDRNNRKVVSVTPTVSNGVAYTAADAVGGLVTLTDFFDYVGQVAILNSFLLFDDDNQNTATYHIFFANESWTAAADNAAFSVPDAERSRITGLVSIPAATVVNLTNNCVFQGSAFNSFLPLPMVSGTTRNLYLQLRTGGTPTFASTTSLNLKLVFEMVP